MTRVDAGRAAETELRQEAMDLVDAERLGQVVEIDVAGLDDGLFERRPAVAPFLPVTVLVVVSGQGEPARAERGRVDPDLAIGHAGQADEGFEGRSRGILAVDGPVEEWPVRGITECGIALVIDAGHEEIGIEARQADIDEDIAILRVDGDDGAGMVTHGLGREALQMAVDRQIEVFAGHGRYPLEGPDRSPERIGLDVFEADLAMQAGLVVSLDTRLADEACRAVVRGIEAAELADVDASDITQTVGQQWAEWIVTDEASADLDARQLVEVDGEPRDLGIVEVIAQRDGIEGPLAMSLTLEPFEVGITEPHEFAESHERCVEVVDLLGNEFEAERGQVLGDDLAIPVVDQAPGRCEWMDGDAVLVRQRREVRVVDDLELDHAAGQHGESDKDADEGDDGPVVEQATFTDMVLERYSVGHGLAQRMCWSRRTLRNTTKTAGQTKALARGGSR